MSPQALVLLEDGGTEQLEVERSAGLFGNQFMSRNKVRLRWGQEEVRIVSNVAFGKSLNHFVSQFPYL